MTVGDFLNANWRRIARLVFATGATALYVATVKFYEGRIELLNQQLEMSKQTNEMLRHTQFDAQFTQIDAEQKLAAMRMKRVVSSIQVLGGENLDPDDVAHRYMCLRLER